MFAIGEAARRSGVGVEAIRFYEREGVVPKPERSASNRRLYSASEVGRLRFLKKCRNLGFSLADARTLVNLSDSHDADCQAAKKLGETHTLKVREKIKELKRLEAALVELTSNCDAGKVACPMLEKLSSE